MNVAYPEEVLCVALFGSKARSDDDAYSDHDLLVVVDDVPFVRLTELQIELAKVCSVEEESFSIYQRRTFEHMVNKGRLFVHHLARESRVIYDPRSYLADCFRKLGSFSSYKSDLETYQTLFEMVAVNLSSDPGLTECDMHLLHMVARNTAMLLCFKAGQAQFGREAPLRKAIEIFEDLGFTIDVASELGHWALVYQRNIPIKLDFPSRGRQQEIVEAVEAILRFSKGLTSD